MYSNSALFLEDDLSALAIGAPPLTPAQESLVAAVVSESNFRDLTVVHILPGMGRTTVLKAIHQRVGGAFLGLRHVLNSAMRRAGESLDAAASAFSRMIGQHSTVLVDDGHLLARCGLGTMLDNIHAEKRLVVALDGTTVIPPLQRRALALRMKNFGPADYAGIVRHYLGGSLEHLDISEVFRYSPALSAQEIKHASLWLGLRYEAPDTSAMIRYLALRNSR